tara:strand:+ start:153 stop:515 length:363 start_codon:yes stop_codon:yes gene_type:complete
MPVIGQSSKFVTKSVSLTTTADTDCYVVPNNYSSHVEHLLIGNNDSSNRNYTLKFYDNDDATTYTIFSDHAVAGKGSESVFTIDRPLYIHQKDKIIVQAGTANTLTVTIVAEEFFDPART